MFTKCLQAWVLAYEKPLCKFGFIDKLFSVVEGSHSQRNSLYVFCISFRFLPLPLSCFSPFLLVHPVVLYGSEKDNFGKGNHLAEDEPDVNHLDVRGGGQALHLADKDGGQHQHGGQVHTQSRLKEKGLEEGGGKGDRNENE